MKVTLVTLLALAASAMATEAMPADKDMPAVMEKHKSKHHEEKEEHPMEKHVHQHCPQLTGVCKKILATVYDKFAAGEFDTARAGHASATHRSFKEIVESETKEHTECYKPIVTCAEKWVHVHHG